MELMQPTDHHAVMFLIVPCPIVNCELVQIYTVGGAYVKHHTYVMPLVPYCPLSQPVGQVNSLDGFYKLHVITGRGTLL